VILTDVDNGPSQRVAEKLGFVRVGGSGSLHVYRLA